MATAIFWPTQLTYQSRPIVNLFNFCVFHPILIRFGLGANFGLKRTWNKLKNYLGIMSAKGRPQESCSLADGRLTDSSSPLSSLLCFTILSSAPALLLPCFCPAPALLLVLPTLFWQPSSSSSAPYDIFRHGESRLLWYDSMVSQRDIMIWQIGMTVWYDSMVRQYDMTSFHHNF